MQLIRHAVAHSNGFSEAPYSIANPLRGRLVLTSKLGDTRWNNHGQGQAFLAHLSAKTCEITAQRKKQDLVVFLMEQFSEALVSEAPVWEASVLKAFASEAPTNNAISSVF